MLNAVARELGQAELAKTPEAERSEALLRALREAEVLLVLDNLETLPERDRDQLFAFLNRLPRGSSALVTSRRRADASAVTVRLDRLDWPAAHELLAELVKHNDRLRRATEPELRSLYEETGGNPLLLRWVAGQLGRCRTVAAALDFLRSAPAGNNPLEFIFGDLLGTFTPNETRILAALSHFTGAMAVKFIAELAGLHEAAAHWQEAKAGARERATAIRLRGLGHRLKADYPAAIAAYREALGLSEKLGRQELIALDCRYLAKALARQGKNAEALPFARRAVEIYTRLGSPDLAYARATLAECEDPM